MRILWRGTFRGWRPGCSRRKAMMRRRFGRSSRGPGSPSPRFTTTSGARKGWPRRWSRCRCRAWWSSCGRSSRPSGIRSRCLEQILEAHFDFCREDPDRSRFLYALIFGPPGSEPAHDLECCKEDLARWVEAAIRRLAEAGIIRRDRVGRVRHDVPRADRDRDPRFPLRRQTPGTGPGADAGQRPASGLRRSPVAPRYGIRP